MGSIRRIREDDCEQDFQTGLHGFDCDAQGKKLDLNFYYERDNSGKYESYVFDEKGEIVGVLCIQKQKDCLYWSRIGVKKGHTGKGYGSELTLFALKKAIEHNTRKITLKAHDGAWGFLRDMGFRKVREYYDSHWKRMCAEMVLELEY